MGVYRSAQGKMVDMAALASRNAKTRAVGNMRVNARGDEIDSFGKVITPVTEKVTEKYGKSVGNRSANAVKKAPLKNSITEDLTDFEQKMNSEFEEDDKAIEELKASEKGKK